MGKNGVIALERIWVSDFIRVRWNFGICDRPRFLYRRHTRKVEKKKSSEENVFMDELKQLSIAIPSLYNGIYSLREPLPTNTTSYVKFRFIKRSAADPGEVVSHCRIISKQTR